MQYVKSNFVLLFGWKTLYPITGICIPGTKYSTLNIINGNSLLILYFPFNISSHCPNCIVDISYSLFFWFSVDVIWYIASASFKI